MSEEVKKKMNQKHNLKAPNSKGLPTLFFKKYWNIVGEVIVDLVGYFK